MDIRVEKRSLGNPSNWPTLGVAGDNNVENIRFLMDRHTPAGVDLAYGTAYVIYVLKDGTSGFVPIVGGDKVVGEQTLALNWRIGKQVTAQPGTVAVAVKISGPNSELWHSETARFTIAPTLNVETPAPLPRARAAALPVLFSENPDTEPPITVSERTVVIPNELQNIAVQNDSRSEQVRIILPRYFDGNDLSKFAIVLKCISAAGGRSDVPFLNPEVNETEIHLYWTLKPPETSYAGKLSLQIYVEGKNADGSDFKWETFGDSAVNIKPSLDAEPVIPTTPSIMDEFLKQITGIAGEAKTSQTKADQSAVDAKNSRDQSEGFAKKAEESAGQAADSAVQAKGSENAAADSLTNIHTGLAGKLSITEANKLIKTVTFDGQTGIFTFTYYDGTTDQIDTALEKVAINAYVDEATQDLVFTFEDGTVQRISLSAFFNIYSGGETSTVQVKVEGSSIAASVKGGSVGMNLLTQQAQDTINSKVTANEANNASQIKFSDGESMEDKLLSGALNGKDGVSVAISGMFYMRVDAAGHLIAGVADGADPPPVFVRDGHLIYKIE